MASMIDLLDAGTANLGEDSSLGREPIWITGFRRLVRRALSERGHARRRLRDDIIKFLIDAPEPDRCIHEVVDVCCAWDHHDRLEVAIDVLSKSGDAIVDYAWDYLISDIRRWNHVDSDRAYEPNDDYWYVLLRSVARCQADEARKLRIIGMCRDAQSRGVVEGVVEALGDLATVSATEMLKRIASEHTDSFIKELANELLVDLRS